MQLGAGDFVFVNGGRLSGPGFLMLSPEQHRSTGRYAEGGRSSLSVLNPFYYGNVQTNRKWNSMTSLSLHQQMSSYWSFSNLLSYLSVCEIR